MAKVSFRGFEQYQKQLDALGRVADQGKMLEKAAKVGGGIVADEIRKRLDNLPSDNYHRLEDGETFSGVPVGNHLDLLDSLGVTPPDKDHRGFVHVKVGWDGYGSFPTKAYPEGVPNQLLARAVESGSSVRQKTPFVRPAVQATRKEAVEAMDNTIRDEMEKIMSK